ncbi:ProQ/FINO family protein [Marinobacterium aestuariivivens]|uniref:ProQ/FINO family protein n=1 Tax=Marinobacterium aestuariivivens TaxID=1698799 RepID=A0ABW2A7Z6_9GAMM
MEVKTVIEETEQLLGELDSLLEARERGRERQSMQQSENSKVNEAANSGNSKPKSKNRAANLAAVQLLMDTYPKTFSRHQVRPLKIGIQEDLLADDKVSKNKIKRALASYVRSLAYYRSLQAGAARIDLQGQPAGQVTEEEAEHAKGKLKELNKQRREREKQKQKEQREQEKSERLNNKLEQLVNLNKR